MEEVNFPAVLLLPNSKISIYCEDNNQINKTNRCVIIEGNRSGFISLANLINVYSSYLFDKIFITDFPFVESNFRFFISEELELKFDSSVIMINENLLKWQLTEFKLFETICLLHSLGYANSELHLDEGLRTSDISVYCVVKV